MDRMRLEELAQKYLSGTATEIEKKELHAWYDEENKALSEVIIVQGEASKEEVRQRILRKLKGEIKQDKTLSSNLIQRYKVAISVAATVLVVIGILTWKNLNTTNYMIVETAYGEMQEIVLPDHSTVWVNAGSSLRYPDRFSKNERAVELLNGQAFFDVQRDEKRPFKVRTKDLEIAVLGTSFDVKGYEEEAFAKVSVLSGKVNVVRQGSNLTDGVQLEKGEQVILDIEKQSLKREAIVEEAIAAWKEQRLVFDDERILDVMNALKRRYNIEFVGKAEDWESETISIKLDNQPLDDVLEVLKYTLEFDYKKINDDKIEIIK